MPSAWHVVRRMQSYRGEERANLVRIVAIACFYGIQLINRHGLDLGFIEFEQVEGVNDAFHAAVTALAAAWGALSIGVLVLMRNQRFPVALKYVTTTVDVLLLTSILTIADGPGSPLVVVYFLILAGTPMRFSMPLIRYTTVLVVLGYVALVGEVWLRRPELRIPRYAQLTMIMAFVFTGVALAEFMRGVREAAVNYALRTPRAEDAT